MVTSQQATELREFLIMELNNNGFGNIVIEVNTQLEEDFEEETFKKQPRDLLDFFLTQSIEVLENLSNKNFQNLVNQLNEFTTSKQQIEIIDVELLNSGEQKNYDLKELPNYEKIILTFRKILEEIRKEN